MSGGNTLIVSREVTSPVTPIAATTKIQINRVRKNSHPERQLALEHASREGIETGKATSLHVKTIEKNLSSKFGVSNALPRATAEQEAEVEKRKKQREEKLRRQENEKRMQTANSPAVRNLHDSLIPSSELRTAIRERLAGSLKLNLVYTVISSFVIVDETISPYSDQLSPYETMKNVKYIPSMLTRDDLFTAMLNFPQDYMVILQICNYLNKGAEMNNDATPWHYVIYRREIDSDILNSEKSFMERLFSSFEKGTYYSIIVNLAISVQQLQPVSPITLSNEEDEDVVESWER